MKTIGEMISELQRDYELHGSTWSNPAWWAVCNYRIGRWATSLPPLTRDLASKLYGTASWLVELASGITLHREAEIGAGLHLVHAGNIKIHPRSRIGARVGIMHDVTLGAVVDREGAPELGDDVFVGAGAKILGPVKVGNGARIAANSLVVTDIPAGSTAIGVPARVMGYTGRA